MKISCFVLALSCFLFAGCKNISPATQRSIETGIVGTGTAAGLAKYPEARPYVQAATPVVCNLANSTTNVTAAQFAQAVQNDPNAASLSNPAGTLILTTAFGVYSALEDQFGTNSAAMKNYMGGLCDGLNLGLSLSPTKVLASPRIVK